MTNIYHITHLNNLQAIVNSGGLIAKKRHQQKGVICVDIAYEHIQDRRAVIPVTCAAGGCLHDYVPFYFAPRSPMLYTISKGNVQGYQGGQNPILHLVVEAETIKAADIPFCFTDGHAVMKYSLFFEDLSLLDEAIDWDVMKSQYWNDTNHNPDRKRRRQAEFLVYQFCPWELIYEIGVINATIQKEVQTILQSETYKPSIIINKNWYY